jgi:hypothetical protein
MEKENVQGEKSQEEKYAEVEKKFEFLAQEASRTFLENTKNRHSELEKKIKEFIGQIEGTITKKCENEIKNIIEVSQNEQFYDQVRGNVLISRRPISGKEEEYTLQSQNLMQCMKPYLIFAETVLDHRNSYKQMNNYSYKFCLDECRSSLKNSFNNNSLNYDGVKYCLKDCYNLGSFNFKSYYQYMMANIEMKMEEFNKL